MRNRKHLIVSAVMLATLLTLGLALVSAQSIGDECYETKTVEALKVNPFNPAAGARVVSGEEREYNDDCLEIQDDRINRDGAAPAAIYCLDAGSIAVYDINDLGDGDLILLVTPDALEKSPALPEENTLIEGNGGFGLYRLTSGELQLNTPPDWEGKSYVFVWDGCQS